MQVARVFRRLARTPTFTTVAAVTLAAGIGANAAIFSVIDGVLLNPLPYPQPEQLVDLNHTAPGVNFPDAGSAPFLYFTYLDQGRTFQHEGLYSWTRRSVTGLREPEEVLGLNLTADVLPALAVPPLVGRWFSAADDSPGSPLTVILTNGWWQARFGGDRSVVGQRILVDGLSREVIGIMPARFRFLDRDAVLILPLQLDRSKTVLGAFDYRGIARLKPAVTLAQATADVSRLIPVALHSFPVSPGLTLKAFEDVRLGPKTAYLKDAVVGDISETLWVLMATLGVVLLIACANVTNLLLVRADGRQQELAVRAALGASWRDLASELLLESLALGLIGGAVGLGLAAGAVRALIALAPTQLPRLSEISITPLVILFTFATSLLAVFLFGLIPVAKYANPRIARALRGEGRAASVSRERQRARSLLVVVQIALCAVLLVGAGLMMRTFQALRRVDPGFDPHGALTLRIAIPEALVPESSVVVQLERDILDKMATISGVAAVGITSVIPTEPGGSDLVYARDKSYGDSVPPLRRLKFVSPGLLTTMGNRLVAGRDFTWTETLARYPVALVSENLARELWRDPQHALGKQIREDLQGPWREVVGVVADEREDGVQHPAPAAAYYPLAMNEFEGKTVAVRRSVVFIVRSSRAGTSGLLADVQRAVWSLNPSLPLANVRTLQEILDRSLARTSFTLVTLALAGAMALLIGVVGIYGVISYAVSQRNREIGIKLALGARQGQIVTTFARQGLALALVGVGCGLVIALPLTRALGSVLFDVNPLDPWTYAVVSVGLIVVAVTASSLPVVTAAVSPSSTLQSG